jgi:hypothetical protein
MADLFSLESTADVAAGSSGSRVGTALDTGLLRRKFNFGDRVSELSIASDPFFRMVSKLAKKPTDDPEFKFTERRPSFHKRYAYVVNHGTSAPASSAGANATVTHGNVDAGDVYYLTMATDYKSTGNIQNVYGQSSGEISVADSSTQPGFFLEDQIVKIPYMTGVTAGSWDDSSASSASSADDYLVVKVMDVDTASVSNCANLKVKVVSKGGASADFELASYSAYNNALDGLDISGKSISAYLEPKRCYVIGSAHAQGSGYPETWKDQPFSTGYGRTQIWKTAMAMDNTTRATTLKYEPNEFARVWKEKLVEHKWDIEQSILFGSQYDSGDEWYTQGAVDFISSFGNVFSLSIASKTQDDFLDDMSNFLDPRYNNANASLFFCDTATYNWLHKLSGFFSNNLEVSPNFRADMSLTAKKKVFGVDISVISTPYGDMNVARNIHLDGHKIKMLAVNMRHCAYRPLVGNGLNRDTAIYVGVQTLENSGVDRRVDLIQTEAGMEWQMPEAHAYWS